MEARRTQRSLLRAGHGARAVSGRDPGLAKSVAARGAGAETADGKGHVIAVRHAASVGPSLATGTVGPDPRTDADRAAKTVAGRTVVATVRHQVRKSINHLTTTIQSQQRTRSPGTMTKRRPALKTKTLPATEETTGTAPPAQSPSSRSSRRCPSYRRRRSSKWNLTTWKFPTRLELRASNTSAGFFSGDVMTIACY